MPCFFLLYLRSPHKTFWVQVKKIFDAKNILPTRMESARRNPSPISFSKIRFNSLSFGRRELIRKWLQQVKRWPLFAKRWNRPLLRKKKGLDALFNQFQENLLQRPEQNFLVFLGYPFDYCNHKGKESPALLWK